MKEREELKLVTDFGELQAGMVVVLKECGWCGADYRTMLLTKEHGVLCAPDGTRTDQWFWRGSNHHECPVAGALKVAASERTVRLRATFRVETGLDTDATQREGADLATHAEVARRVLARQRT